MNTKLTANPGAIAGWKDALVKDLRDVVGAADDLLKEVASSTSEEYAEARTKIEARLDEAKSRLDDARILVKRKACGAADATDKYARDNPWKLLGVAVAAGAAICFLLDRR